MSNNTAITHHLDSDSSPLLDWIAMQRYKKYLIDNQVIIRKSPTVPGRKQSGKYSGKTYL